jgi:hypothetical protein
VWYERSVTKAIFLALVLLVLLTGAFALHLAWENTPEAEAQGAIQQPGPIQEPGPIQQPGPQQKGGQLMNAGGSADGPAPVMPGGGCPTELPIERDGACYR